MKKLTLAQASRPLADYAEELGEDFVVVTKGRRAFAALVPLTNVDRESLALRAHPIFLKIVGLSRAEIAAGKTISLAEMRKRVLPRRAPNKRLHGAAAKRQGA